MSEVFLLIRDPHKVDGINDSYDNLPIGGYASAKDAFFDCETLNALGASMGRALPPLPESKHHWRFSERQHEIRDKIRHYDPSWNFFCSTEWAVVPVKWHEAGIDI